MAARIGPPEDRPGVVSQIRVRDQSLTITFTGPLTAASVPVVRPHLFTLTAASGPEELILDLSGVDTVDVEGAEPLLEAQERQYRRGGVLRLVQTSPSVLRFFHSESRFARLLIPPTEAAHAETSQRPEATHPAAPGQPFGELHQLRAALESRTVTAQATGLLAARFGIPADQAWSLLRETSHRSNRKVADVARIVMQTHDNVPITADADLRVAVALAEVLDVSVARVLAGP